MQIYKTSLMQCFKPCSIKTDVVAKTDGLDPRGRVRGLGFGALPSKVDGQTRVANKVTMLENALAAQTQQVDRLTELVQGLVARLDKGENVNVAYVENDPGGGSDVETSGGPVHPQTLRL